MILPELRKVRRLKIMPLVFIMVIAVVLMSGFPLFRKNAQLSDVDILMMVTLMQSFLAPVFVSIVATRLVEIEHSGNGWQISGSVGFSKGQLCVTKAIVVGAIITAATLLELLIIVGLLSVFRVPDINLQAWVIYGVGLVVVNLILGMLHVILAAIVDNQLVNIGVGVLGAFFGVFSLLLPVVVSYIQPWGYYAVISPVAQTASGMDYVDPNYMAVALFACLGLGAFAASVRFLNHSER